MALGEADIFQVVVLAASAHALLAACRPRIIAFFEAEENVLELVHSRIRKQQGWISMRHQRRAAHDFVPLLLKKFEEGRADLIPAPELRAFLFPRHFILLVTFPVFFYSVPFTVRF